MGIYTREMGFNGVGFYVADDFRIFDKDNEKSEIGVIEIGEDDFEKEEARYWKRESRKQN